MKDLLIFVPTGFEDIELIASLDIFQREEVTYDLVSFEQLRSVRGKFEAYVDTKPLEEVKDLKDYKGLFLPGGPGYTLYSENEEVLKTIREYKAEGKLLSAICAAPVALENAGAIDENVVFAAHPKYDGKYTPTENALEVSGDIITGDGFVITIEFAKAVAKAIKER